MINTLFNPLYNKGQIVNFTDYLLHPQVTPLIENKTLTVHYVIMDKNGKTYPNFHRTVNEFLGSNLFLTWNIFDYYSAYIH